jgi:hypothetical protein
MSSKEIIIAASDPDFYMRVSFISLKVAQAVATEDPTTANHNNRVAYSCRIIQGADNAILLSQHVASSNPTISGALEEGGPDAVPDADIEFALASIWDARANAFAVLIMPAMPMAAPTPPDTPTT